MSEKRDYYEVLGVAKTAAQAEIRTAYRKLARQYHPDLNKGEDAEDRFKEVNEAYEVLSNDQKRAQYDRFGHAGLGGQGGFGAGGFDGGISEIFEQFFGGAFTRGSGGAPRRHGPTPGQDLRASITIDFEEAVRGTQVQLTIQRFEQCTTCKGNGSAPGTTPIRCVQCAGMGEVRTARQSIFGQVVVTDVCPRCKGEGEVVTSPCAACNGQRRRKVSRTLEVSVPAGIDDQMRIRLSGEGDEGLRGGTSGNLYVDVHVRPHEYFRRDGQNILLELELNMAQAALGDEVQIPSIDGMVPLSVPAGTQTGQVFRVRGKGVPHVRNEDLRGDMLVTVFVKVPTNLNEEQRELMKQLAATLGSSVNASSGRGWFDKIRDAFK
jgi:molecular chaperone DnaJ